MSWDFGISPKKSYDVGMGGWDHQTYDKFGKGMDP